MSSLVRPLQVSKELPPDLAPELRDRFDYKEEGISLKLQNGLKTVQTDVPSSGRKSKKNHGDKEVSEEELNTSASEGSNKTSSRGRSLSALESTGQQYSYPHRRPASEPIWEAERLTYGISYMGLGAGELTLEVMPFKMMAQRKVYHIRGHAVSSSIFNLFYHLDDVVETFIDFEGIFSHRFHLVLDESKQKRDSLELNDSEKQQTFYWDRIKRGSEPEKENKTFAPIQPFSQDSVSLLYYLRTIPLPIGSVVTVPIVSEGNTWDAICTVVRREVVSSPLGNVPALVIKPEMKFHGILKKGGDSFLWLTDDNRRIPIRLEAKVRIGSVVANLERLELGAPPSLATSASPALSGALSSAQQPSTSSASSQATSSPEFTP